MRKINLLESQYVVLLDHSRDTEDYMFQKLIWIRDRSAKKICNNSGMNFPINIDFVCFCVMFFRVDSHFGNRRLRENLSPNRETKKSGGYPDNQEKQGFRYPVLRSSGLGIHH